MTKTVRNMRRGFTLVEIMIVVLIIGILLAIAVPNFLRAREGSRAKACQGNLNQIYSAKEQAAMDEKLKTGDPVADLWLPYVRGEVAPVCPAGGVYTVGNVDAVPLCDYAGGGAPGTWNAHSLPAAP